MNSTVRHFVDVTVSEDRLTACVALSTGADRANASADRVRADLEAGRIAITEEVDRKIEEYVSLLASGDGNGPVEPFVIARGRAPVDGQDGGLEWIEDPAPPAPTDEDGQLDYRALRSIRTVEADVVIGRVAKPTAGVPGVDVHGTVLRPERCGEPVRLLKNVRLDDDGVTVRSTVAGRVIVKNGQIEIDEVLDIKGDVNFETGNVQATNAVRISGTVVDLFKVTSQKSIVIGRAIEAAEVTAQEGIVVRGGILGRNKGTVTAGGDLAAKFLSEANVRAGGDVHVTKEIINSRVRAGGKLTCDRGAIIGGRAYAKRGISAHTLGSDSCVPTYIRVGVPAETLVRIRQIDEQMKAGLETITRIREMVQPLMANRKRLTSEQKERATELLYKADEMEAQIRAAQEERKALLAEGPQQGEAHVLASVRICQGVTIAIGDRSTSFQREVKGPVKVERRKMENNVTEFVAVNQLTGSLLTLNSMEIDPALEVEQAESPGDAAGKTPGVQSDLKKP